MDALTQLGRPFLAHLQRLDETFSGAGVPYAVIGASAFLLHGIGLRRTTRDLDLALAIEGGLEAIRDLLLTSGLASTGIDHRFRTADRTEIDILAIDTSWTPEHEIQLAGGDTLRAFGLPEGLRSPVEIDVNGRGIPVVSLPMLIAMKLVVAGSGSRPHDLEDACEALAAYEASGDRRFFIDYDRHSDLRYETAGAFLAGLDAAGMIGPATESALREAIDRLLQGARLTDRHAQGPVRRELIHAFRTGLDGTPSPGSGR